MICLVRVGPSRLVFLPTIFAPKSGKRGDIAECQQWDSQVLTRLTCITKHRVSKLARLLTGYPQAVDSVDLMSPDGHRLLEIVTKDMGYESNV
jgi:hypothetical protein